MVMKNRRANHPTTTMILLYSFIYIYISPKSLKRIISARDAPNNIHTMQIKSHIVIPAENLTTPRVCTNIHCNARASFKLHCG